MFLQRTNHRPHHCHHLLELWTSMRFSENMDGTAKHQRQLKQEKAKPQKLLGREEECRLYFLRLGELLKNFKQRVIRIGFSSRSIILAVCVGEEADGARLKTRRPVVWLSQHPWQEMKMDWIKIKM